MERLRLLIENSFYGSLLAKKKYYTLRTPTRSQMGIEKSSWTTDDSLTTNV
jgi:hypothetical protein